MDGWGFFTTTTAGSTARFSADTGSSNSGSIFSYGSSGSSDRALGSLASSSNVSKIGLTLVNDTGSTITSFVVTFDSEIWRRGDQPNTTNELAFDYAMGAAPLLSDPTTSFAASARIQRDPFPPRGPTASGARAAKTEIQPISEQQESPARSVALVGPGQELVLRWSDKDDTGSDDGIALDNFHLTLPGSPGAISFGNASQQFDESAGTVNIPVVRSGGSTGAISVTYSIDGGTATQKAISLCQSVMC